MKTEAFWAFALGATFVLAIIFLIALDHWQHPEIYKKNPFDYKVLKTDIDKYMDADGDLIKSVTKIDYYQTMLNYLDSILKTIQNRTYQIKNSIDFLKFTAGYD